MDITTEKKLICLSQLQNFPVVVFYNSHKDRFEVNYDDKMASTFDYTQEMIENALLYELER